MDEQKSTLIHLLNALMACLGVVAGGLVICGLLLAFIPSSGQPDSSEDPLGSQHPSQDAQAGIESENEEQALLKAYEEAITSGTATEETYLRLADLWINRGEMDRAEQILHQGIEQLGGNVALEERLVQLTGEPLEKAAPDKMLRKDTYDTSGNLAWSHVYQYDEQGRMSGVTSYNAAGTQTGFVEILYDAAGNQIQAYSWETGIGEGSGRVFPILYRYDATGRMDKEEVYFNNELDFYLIYQYDESDQIIQSDNYYPDGTLMLYSLYTYTADGIVARVDSYAPDGRLETYSEWTYDADGKRTAYASYNADGTELIQYAYVYDENGKIVQEKTTDGRTTTIAYIQYE